MATFDGNNFYFSGQGVVLIGERDSLGRPKGLIPVGNVSDLKISVATSVLEHKESQTGQRGIDLRLTTEIKATMSATLENFIADNLALALRGDTAVVVGAALTDEAINLYIGKIMPLAHAKVSALTVTTAAVTLTAYTNDATPYDYKFNADAGSVQFNDGAIVLTDKLPEGGEVITGVTAADPVQITVGAVPAYVEVGGYACLSGVTGADAADLNGKSFKILAKTSTTIDIDFDGAGQTYTATGFVDTDGAPILVDYTFETQNQVEALTVGSQERYLRFEGLNTADNNSPVVVEVFKFQVDPLKELALISDTVQQYVLEGNVLADQLQTTGSNYFKQTMLR